MSVIGNVPRIPFRPVRTPDTQLGLAARFWACASGFWRGPDAWKAWALTVLAISSVFLQLLIQYRLNYWGRDFFDAFGRRDGGTLQAQAWVFVPLAGASLLATVFGVWTRMTTQRRWRAWLSRHLIGRWLSHAQFRRLAFTVGEDQNPEYRIAEDARAATDAPIALGLGLLNAVLSAIIFIGVLWNVGGDLAIEVRGYTLTIPKYLVIAVGVYSALLTLMAMLIGHRLVSVVASKNAAEAQFRSVGSHLQERSPAPAPASLDETAQQHALVGALDVVIASWRRVCFQLMRMTMVSQGNLLLAPVVAWGLCAPKYLVGSLSLGEVAQVTAAFITVQAALNWFVENYAGLADCMSSVNRVASLLLAFDQLDSDNPASATAHSEGLVKADRSGRLAVHGTPRFLREEIPDGQE